MKKNRLFLILLLVSMCTVSFNVLYGTSTKITVFDQKQDQKQDRKRDQQIDLFKFVSTELRKPSYAQDILPNDFSYLQSMIEHGHRLPNRQEYLRSVMSIFSKIMMASPYINAYAFLGALEDLPGQLVPYFTCYKEVGSRQYRMGVDTDMFDRFKETVDNLLYIRFSSQYDIFKADPEKFLHGLAEQVVDMAKQELDTERLRITIKRFLELNISKLVWSPEEHDEIWDNVKSISRYLEVLMEKEIIVDLNDLDDMYWTLIHRFNYFLDITSTELPISFYQKIKKDIYQDSSLKMLKLEEQDICIQSKKEVFIASLLQAEARRRAFDIGVITE